MRTFHYIILSLVLCFSLLSKASNDFSVGIAIPYAWPAAGITNIIPQLRDENSMQEKLCKGTSNEINLINKRLKEQRLGLSIQLHDCVLSTKIKPREVLNPEDISIYSVAIKVELVPESPSLDLNTFRIQRKDCLSNQEISSDNSPAYEKYVGLGNAVNNSMRRIMLALGFSPAQYENPKDAIRYERNYFLNGCIYGSLITATYLDRPYINTEAFGDQRTVFIDDANHSIDP